jgi:hypothetical protein
MLAAASLLAVSACSSSPAAPAARPVSTATAPAGAAQPFEMVHFAAKDAYDGAIWRYQVKCATARGFIVTDQPTYDSGSSLIQSADKLGDTTPEAARRDGLHTGPVPDPNWTPPPKPSAAVSTALTDCLNEAVTKLGHDTTKADDDFIALMNDLSNDFYTDFGPTLNDSFVEVNECVAAAGWKPTDQAKVTDPNVSPAQLFGVQTAVDVTTNGRTSYTPLPREIDLALAMAKCRTNAKMTPRLLEVAIQLQTPIVAKYEQRIVQVNHDIDAAAARAAKVLG